jgi:hypothetical protein
MAPSAELEATLKEKDFSIAQDLPKPSVTTNLADFFSALTMNILVAIFSVPYTVDPSIYHL